AERPGHRGSGSEKPDDRRPVAVAAGGGYRQSPGISRGRREQNRIGGRIMAVAVIIPAFNEERTVGRVIRAARNSPGISQIIVVNDGSTDRTAAIAEKAGAKVIDLSAN